jgi:hypothetical protein
MAKKAKKAATAPETVSSKVVDGRKVTIRTAKNLDQMLLAIKGYTKDAIFEMGQKTGISAESYRLLFAALLARDVARSARAAEARAKA